MAVDMDVCTCMAADIKRFPAPLFRLVCHCTTCRSYTGQDSFDECTFLLKDCGRLAFDRVDFKSYQKGFSPMKRGRCKACGKVAFSTIHVWPFPAFVTVPSQMLTAQQYPMPQPFAHLYYGSRVQDVSDTIRKIQGHALSQLAIQWHMVKGLLARRLTARTAVAR